MTELSRTLARLDEVLQDLRRAAERAQEPGAAQREGALGDARMAKETHAELSERLGPLADKFRKRSVERDPETQEFKYGERYRVRASQVLEKHGEALAACLVILEKLSGVQEAAAAAERERRRAEQAAAQEAAELAAAEALRKKEAEAAAETARQEREKIEKEERLANAAREVLAAQLTDEYRVHAADSRVVTSFLRECGRPGGAAVSAALGIMRGFASSGDRERSDAVRALKELRQLVSGVVAHPESDELRTVNAMNERFRTVASVPGARELLVAVGFELRFRTEEDEEGVETQHVTYVLVEPDLAEDMDGWTAWFEALKSALGLIDSYTV